MILKNRISQLREQYGYSRLELGEMVGVSRMAVYNWEKLKTGISHKHVSQLCLVFSCTFKDLFIL